MPTITIDDLVGHWAYALGGTNIEDHVYIAISNTSGTYGYKSYDLDKSADPAETGSVTFDAEKQQATFHADGGSTFSYQVSSGPAGMSFDASGGGVLYRKVDLVAEFQIRNDSGTYNKTLVKQEGSFTKITVDEIDVEVGQTLLLRYDIKGDTLADAWIVWNSGGAPSCVSKARLGNTAGVIFDDNSGDADEGNYSFTLKAKGGDCDPTIVNRPRIPPSAM